MNLWIARDEFGILSLHKTNGPQEVELKLKNELSFEEMEELIDDLI